MANLLDDDNFVIHGGVQTLCVLTLDLAGRPRAPMRFPSGNCSYCSYWLNDRAVVLYALIVYGDNLWCLTSVMMKGLHPC